METRLIIPLEEFPDEGLRLTGELDGALFGIDCDAVCSVGPLSYELEAQLFETELVVQGRLSAPFRLRCDRCLAWFDYTVKLEKVSLSCEVKGKAYADLTDEVREEVLLELPSYPKCELSGLECKINEEFGDFRLDKDPVSGVDSATSSGQGVWDALDQLPRK